MAVRTRQYFLDLFVPGYTLRAEDLDDLAESVAFASELAAVVAGQPIGPAGGALSGTYPNPELAAIQGLTAGQYTNPILTINVQGQVVAIENGQSPGIGTGNGNDPTRQYSVSGTEVRFSGDYGDGVVTLSTNGAGEMTFAIPSKVFNFYVAIPSSVIGLRPTNDVVINFDFQNDGLFNRSENSMRYPIVGIHSRATEGSGGFDVELLGNNPQRRLLPYDNNNPGRCTSQIAGLTDPFTLVYKF